MCDDAIDYEANALGDDDHALTSISKQQRKKTGKQKPHKLRKAQERARKEAEDAEFYAKLMEEEYEFNMAIGEYYRSLLYESKVAM